MIAASDFNLPDAQHPATLPEAAPSGDFETVVGDDLEFSGLETEPTRPGTIPAPAAAALVMDPAVTLSEAQAEVNRPRQSLVKAADEVERISARLRHLCRLIARERRPYCPINGILLLIPLAATDDDIDSKETASLCYRDLITAREALRVYCPIFAVLCDLDRTPGYGEFARHFPEDQRRRLLGQPFPLVPDLDPTTKLRKIEQGVQWIGNVLIPSLVYKFWRNEANPREGPDSSTTANIRLFRFLSELRDRQRRFSRIVTRGIVLQSQGPLMLAGCYLAATGRDPGRQQGFITGVFRYLVENQNYVAWTPAALDEDDDYRHWTSYGYVGLGGIIALLALVIALLAWPMR